MLMISDRRAHATTRSHMQVALVAFVAGLGACTFNPGTPHGSTTGGGGSGTGSGGSGGPGPVINGLTSLRIDPTTADVSVKLGAPATQQFHAIGKYADGHEDDVTAKVGWTVDRPL